MLNRNHHRKQHAAAGRASGGAPAQRCDLVLGLGETGLSCARFLAARGHHVLVNDSRAAPPAQARVAAELPAVETAVGGFDPALLGRAQRVVLSPGLPLNLPIVQEAQRLGLPVVGDMDLFIEAANAPVVGITGSNGKSTVTAWLDEVLGGAGFDVRTGGNLGTPALDLLSDPAPNFYLLELSSFQLERAAPMNLRCAALLNLSPDHLDHHGDLAAYYAAKARIFRRAEAAVICRDDPAIAPLAAGVPRILRFGQDAPRGQDYGLVESASRTWLVRGEERLLDARELRLFARHDQVNALAVLAVGEALGLAFAEMRDGLTRFVGLPHRMQWVAEQGGVRWINDSKGTNPGATLAAIASVPGPLVLIAGGDAKGADLAPLAAALRGRARAVVTLGKDAELIEQILSGICDTRRVADMAAAVHAAAGFARSGDTVLLSPACASLDMYRDYRARGDAFVAALESLA